MVDAYEHYAMLKNMCKEDEIRSKQNKKKPKRKPLRVKVWLKYNKHCAYCGKVLEYKDMQVDHIEPLAYAPFPNDKNSGVYSFGNLMPSCRRCNHYKRAKNLEEFRRLIQTLHERIQDQYISKVAINYGIIEIKPFKGKFYFEKGGEKLEQIKDVKDRALY